jgi:hypothetical protein
MTRVGLLFLCVFALVGCFEPRKVSLGTLPNSGPKAGSGGQRAAGMMDEMDEMEEGEQENDDIDDPESGDSPGEDDRAP